MKQKFHNVYAWGDEEKELLQIQKKFLKYFPKKGTILDLGSGRGVFLHLLEKGGFDPIGVEMDKTMYEVSKQAGYNTVHNDALSYLRKTKKRFDGIFASHIIEHMDINEGVEMIELIKAHLKPKGVAIIITPRPGSLWATENFWLDTTHVRPYPLELMKRLFKPLKFVEGGIEPDSYVLKHQGRKAKLKAKIRKILIGEELFDFVYGGGVWYIVVKKQ